MLLTGTLTLMISCSLDYDNPVYSVIAPEFPIKVGGQFIQSYPGTPTSEFNGEVSWDNNDAPQGLIINYEDQRKYPTFEKRAVYGNKAYNVLRVYSLEHIEKHETLHAELQKLRLALKEKPSFSEMKNKDFNDPLFRLPEFPYRHAGHIVECKIHYHNFSWGSGVSYVVGLSNGLGYYPSNEDLTYFFQGISNDNQYYISADFRITHPSLPKSIDSTPDHLGYGETTERIEQKLNSSSNSSFNPNLEKIHTWISKIEVKMGKPNNKGY